MEEASRLQVSDELVQTVTLHIPRPTLLHGYSWPFIFLYGAWFYLWVFVYGVDEHPEAGWLALAGIGIAQILVSLSCYWSVHVRTFLTCSNTDDPSKAVLAKVVPTPNNGSSKLVVIQKTRVYYSPLYFLLSNINVCSSSCRTQMEESPRCGLCSRRPGTIGTSQSRNLEESLSLLKNLMNIILTGRATKLMLRLQVLSRNMARMSKLFMILKSCLVQVSINCT